MPLSGFKAPVEGIGLHIRPPHFVLTRSQRKPWMYWRYSPWSCPVRPGRLRQAFLWRFPFQGLTNIPAAARQDAVQICLHAALSPASSSRLCHGSRLVRQARAPFSRRVVFTWSRKKGAASHPRYCCIAAQGHWRHMLLVSGVSMSRGTMGTLQGALASKILVVMILQCPHRPPYCINENL